MPAGESSSHNTTPGYLRRFRTLAAAQCGLRLHRRGRGCKAYGETWEGRCQARPGPMSGCQVRRCSETSTVRTPSRSEGNGALAQLAQTSVVNCRGVEGSRDAIPLMRGWDRLALPGSRAPLSVRLFLCRLAPRGVSRRKTDGVPARRTAHAHELSSGRYAL